MVDSIGVRSRGWTGECEMPFEEVGVEGCGVERRIGGYG